MAAVAMPRLNSLRSSVHDRAMDYRNNSDQASEDAALDTGGGAAQLQTRIDNQKSRAMAMNNPEWDDWFQSVRDAGDGRPVKLLGGPSPDGSNQITGLPSQSSGDGSIDALHGRVRPMPDSQDVWRAKTRQRIYGDT